MSQKLTDNDIEYLGILYHEEGWTFEELSLEFGINHKTIQRHFKRLDIKSRPANKKKNSNIKRNLIMGFSRKSKKDHYLRRQAAYSGYPKRPTGRLPDIDKE